MGTPRTCMSVAAIAVMLAPLPACDPAPDRSIPPLSAAARDGDLQLMTRLLGRGADSNERDGRPTGWPPLMHALHKGQIDAASLLLRRGADPNRGSPSGYTALMMAVAQNEPDAVKLLMNAGASARGAAANGMTPLTLAVGGGFIGCRPRIVRQLLALDPTLTLPDTAAGRDARWWADLRAGLQKVRNVALVPTVGAQRAIACGEVIELLTGRTSALSTATPGR